jgi:hypothetical protein
MTIFDSATPTVVDSGDPASVELGVKFFSDVSGTITALRFYKAAANTGTHVGNLWTQSGTKLSTVTFSGESASGWQQAQLTTPVSITAGTTYVVSYFAPSGRYSATPSAFTSIVDNSPLHALSNSVSPNGVYAYSSTSRFPTDSYQATDYGVDVVFAAAAPITAPGAPTNVTATAGSGSATVSWTAPSSGGAPTSYVVTPYVGTTAQTALAQTVTGSPPATTTTVSGLTAGTTYTFKVVAHNAAGDGPASTSSNAVTPPAATAPGTPTGVTASPQTSAAQVSWTAPSSNGGSAITGYTVTPYNGTTALTPTTVGGSTLSTTVTGLTNGTAYTFTVKATNAVGAGAESAASAAVTPITTIFNGAVPATVNVADGSSVELGVKFRSDVAGRVTGLRFYKSSANTGTHTGHLWSAAGTSLATGTFSGESASGWQQLNFTTPVAITAGTIYVASYFAPNGHYSATGGAFNSAFDNAPLHALATSTSPNGVYIYSASSRFPTQTYNATNYGVDIVFAPGS